MKPLYSCFRAFVMYIPHLNLKSNQWFSKTKLEMALLSLPTAVLKSCYFMTLFPLNHQLRIGERQTLVLTHRLNHHSHRLHFSDISYSLKFCKFVVVHWTEWLPDGVEFHLLYIYSTFQSIIYVVPNNIHSVWNSSSAYDISQNSFWQKNPRLEFYVDKVYYFLLNIP